MCDLRTPMWRWSRNSKTISQPNVMLKPITMKLAHYLTYRICSRAVLDTIITVHTASITYRSKNHRLLSLACLWPMAEFSQRIILIISILRKYLGRNLIKKCIMRLLSQYHPYLQNQFRFMRLRAPFTKLFNQIWQLPCRIRLPRLMAMYRASMRKLRNNSPSYQSQSMTSW